MTASASAPMGPGSTVVRSSGSGLADVVDLILDKGLVIDAFVRVSLVGIELLTVDARIVIASVDTYLRFAEATNRLDLYEKSRGLPEVVEELTEGGAKSKTRGVIEAARETFEESRRSRDDEEADRERPRRRRREP